MDYSTSVAFTLASVEKLKKTNRPLFRYVTKKIKIEHQFLILIEEQESNIPMVSVS